MSGSRYFYFLVCKQAEKMPIQFTVDIAYGDSSRVLLSRKDEYFHKGKKGLSEDPL